MGSHQPLVSAPGKRALMRIAVVSEMAVKRVATRPLVLEAVRKALVSLACGDGVLFPVTQGGDKDRRWSFGLKSGHSPAVGALGFKYGSYFPENRSRGIPSHSSTTVLLDAESGLPRAMVNAIYLNGLRTAAADAAAVDALARPNASVLGVIGAGSQAEFEVRALAGVRPLHQVKLWSRDPAAAERLRSKLTDLGVEVVVAERAQAVAGSDILVTATAAREPLVFASEVEPGTHISAMGADQPGKQELDPVLVASGRLYADCPGQSVEIGEFQHAARSGRIASSQIAPIGVAIADPRRGRASHDEVTIFDSSGVALQDLFVAEAVLRAATRAELVLTIDF